MNTSRVLRTLLFLSAVFLLLGCDKIKDAAKFDILYNIPDARFTVDSNTVELAGNEELMLEKSIRISVDSLKSKHDIKNIDEAKIDFIRLEIETPPGANLDWIQSIRASVVSETLPELFVASKENNTPGAVTLDLNIEQERITSYLLEESFSIRIYAKVLPPLSVEEITLQLKSRIRITVQPI